MVGGVKFNIKQLTISLYVFAISVALSGCGGGEGGKSGAKESPAGKTSQKGRGNEKTEPKLPKDTFGGEIKLIADSTGSDNEKPLPKPPKDSLAAFLWGKKIVFKKVGSSQSPAMFIYGKNGKITIAIDSPEGFVKAGPTPDAYEVNGL